MTDIEKWNTAVMIAIKDLEEPNRETRQDVSDSEVWLEFWAIREELIKNSYALLRAAE